MNAIPGSWGPQAASAAAEWTRPGHPATAARPTPLDPMRIAKEAAVILALLALNLGGNYGSGVFFFILLLMALRSPESAFKAMAICYLGLLLNTSFVPKTLVWTPGRLGLPFVVLVRYGLELFANPKILLGRTYYLALLLFAATMAMCSLASGWYTHIALFKLTNFIVFTTSTFLLAAMVRERKRDLSEWFVGMILATTAIGLLSIVTGTSRNFALGRGAEAITADSFFNGAFLHPNVHALYASLMFAFLSCVYILSPYRNRLLTLPLMITWLTFMIYSQSRTSIFATLIPFLFLVALAGPRTLRAGRQIRANVKRSTLVVILVGLVASAGVFDLASGGLVSKAVISFLHKWNEKDAEALDTEQMLASRQGLIDQSWANFRENPWTGIGFQVAKTEAFVAMATLFTAPAEKGFLPVAVLEEGGVVGATAFVLFLLTLLGTWYRERNIPAIVVFVAFLTSNMGEATMLAPGGGGAFGWVMVAAATILGDNCWTRAAVGAVRGKRRHSHAPPLGPLGTNWPVPRGAAANAAFFPGSRAGGATPTTG